MYLISLLHVLLSTGVLRGCGEAWERSWYMVDDLTCVHSAVGKTQTVSAPIALLICNAISIKQSSDNNLLASATLFFPPLNLLFKERVSRKTA